MARLYTVGEIIAATGGRAEGLTGDSVCSLSIDSREIAPEGLFVAIKGDRFDGHDFVPQALENGAVAALVSQEKAAGLGDRLIIVPDALGGLVDLARAGRARSAAKIVAVTGSAGKTTTKEAIRAVLAAAGETHASIRSFNNHWGVPLMLARMPENAQFGVFEIGMNHAGEITPLVQLVRPHVAVVTTVAAAHLEFFPSVEAIAAAKAEIFLGLEPGGTAILNADHPYLPVLLEKAREAGVARIVTYGYAPDADWRIEAVEMAESETVARVRHEGGATLADASGSRDVIWWPTRCAAFIVGELFGVERTSAIKALEAFGAPEGRGLTVKLGKGERPLLLIDESYNANGASMVAALDVFAGQRAPGGKKVLVLGDMLELGAESPALHRALKQSVIDAGADRLFLVGPNMAVLGETLDQGTVAGQARPPGGHRSNRAR